MAVILKLYLLFDAILFEVSDLTLVITKLEFFHLHFRSQICVTGMALEILSLWLLYGLISIYANLDTAFLLFGMAQIKFSL